MHDILTKLLQANLAAAAAILLIILARKPIRTVFGARLAYSLWLLVPFSAAASFLPPRPAELLPATPLAPAPLIAAAEDTMAAAWDWGAPALQVGSPFDPALLAAGIWIVGLALMAAWFALKQRQFMDDVAQGDAGPAVVGVFRPRIVTPSDFEDRFDVREQTVVLAHEKIHLARHDARINAAVALTRCVCWFNPLVHIGAYLMRVDQELACDAAVVARHPKARGPYAQALLKAQLAARPLPLGCYWPAGTEHPLMERIEMLQQSNPSTIRRLAGGALIALLTAGAGYAAWAAAPAAAPTVEAPLTYFEEALAPDPEPAAASAQAPAPAPRQAAPAAALAAPADPADICLSNACSAPAAVAQHPCAAPCREYMGTAPIPAGQAFVKYFDGNAPVLLKGRVTGVNWHDGDGMASEVIMQSAEDGRTWRVIGGNAANLSPEQRAAFESAIGQGVVVRGYQTHDKACEGACIANGRDVSFPDGRPVQGAPPVWPPSQPIRQ